MNRFWDFKLAGAPPLLSLVVSPSRTSPSSLAWQRGTHARCAGVRRHSRLAAPSPLRASSRVHAFCFNDRHARARPGFVFVASACAAGDHPGVSRQAGVAMGAAGREVLGASWGSGAVREQSRVRERRVRRANTRLNPAAVRFCGIIRASRRRGLGAVR